MEKIFESITAGGFSPEGYCYCLLAALFCGVVAAFAASYKKREAASTREASHLKKKIKSPVATPPSAL